MTFDSIDRPSHYAEGRRFEPIDVIADWQLNYRLGNVLKYVSRAGRKGCPIEDLKKARWYLLREIQEREGTLPSYETRVDYDEVVEFDRENKKYEYKDYQGPLYAPHPDIASQNHSVTLDFIGDAEWDSNVDYATGFQGKRDTDYFEDNDIIRIIERRGIIIGFKKNGDSCIIGRDGKCQ